MKNSMIALALLMGLSSHAQSPQSTPAPMPTVWQCSADCFTLSGKDGTNLDYFGNVQGYIYLNQTDAFRSLKGLCRGDTLLLKRKFKGSSQQSTVQNAFDHSVSYYYRGYSETSRSYQVINNQTKAQFDVSEADMNNSCEPINSQDFPIYSIAGDPTLG